MWCDRAGGRGERIGLAGCDRRRDVHSVEQDTLSRRATRRWTGTECMRFLESTYVWDWCRTHGFPLIEDQPLVTPRLAPDPALVHSRRALHTAAGNREVAVELAAEACAALGRWQSCLAWATDWDIWENQEDWPRFYAWRGGYNERRSLAAVPGHLFDSADAAELARFVGHAIECGWDVSLLPTLDGGPTGLRIRTSHDEWIALDSTRPVSFIAAAG